MKKLAIAIGLSALSGASLYAQNNVGFYGGFNINMHSPNFGDKATVLFDKNATGLGLNIGGIGNFEIKKDLFFSARVGYNVCSGDLSANTPTNSDIELQSKLHYFEITPALQFHNLIPIDKTYLLGGLEFGIPAKAKYDYKIGTTTYSDSSISDDATRIAFVLGIGYQMKLNNGMNLVPEISFRLPLNNVSSAKYFDSWSVSQLRLGVALTFDIGGTKKDETKTEDKSQTIGNIDVGVKEVRFVNNNGKAQPVKVVKLEETRYTELYPLVPYIFFNENESAFDKNYQRQKALEARGAFKMNDLNNDGLEINRHTLDIIGVRMNEIKNANLTIIGANDGKTEKSAENLSKARADEAKNYLTKKYAIDPNRIEVKFRDLPERPSAIGDPDGIAENRRIEFQSNIPEILDPVKIESDKERLASPDLLEFITYAKAESPIKKWTLTIIQAGRQLRYFEGAGEPQPKQWIIRPNELAASNVPIDFRFFALAEDGSQKEVSGTIPVDYISGVKRKTEETPDKSINKFSLILFDFDKAEINPENMRVIEQMIMPTVKFNSTIKIYGLTDRIGDEKYNKKLSANRAQAVKKAFEGKMKDLKIEVYGLGEDNLIYDNDTPIGRQLCRTVQIVVETPKQ